MEVICRLTSSRLRRGAEHSGGEVCGADRFAVPAGAFAIDPAVGELTVHLAGPLEAVGELVFVHFVVVVDECRQSVLACSAEAICIVS